MRSSPICLQRPRLAPRLLTFAPLALGTTPRAASHDLAAQSVDRPAPSHRRHHAIAYDPASKRVWVYGGQHLVSNSEAPMLDDIWSWDGRQWTQESAGTGIAMIGHQLFADGGALVARDPASRREMSAGASDIRRHRFVLFGGHVDGQSFPGDTWEFDGRRWSRVATNGPPPGWAMSM